MHSGSGMMKRVDSEESADTEEKTPSGGRHHHHHHHAHGRHHLKRGTGLVDCRDDYVDDMPSDTPHARHHKQRRVVTMEDADPKVCG